MGSTERSDIYDQEYYLSLVVAPKVGIGDFWYLMVLIGFYESFEMIPANIIIN